MNCELSICSIIRRLTLKFKLTFKITFALIEHCTYQIFFFKTVTFEINSSQCPFTTLKKSNNGFFSLVSKFTYFIKIYIDQQGAFNYQCAVRTIRNVTFLTFMCIPLSSKSGHILPICRTIWCDKNGEIRAFFKDKVYCKTKTLLRRIIQTYSLFA